MDYISTIEEKTCLTRQKVNDVVDKIENELYAGYNIGVWEKIQAIIDFSEVGGAKWTARWQEFNTVLNSGIPIDAIENEFSNLIAVPLQNLADEWDAINKKKNCEMRADAEFLADWANLLKELKLKLKNFSDAAWEEAEDAIR